MRRTNISSGGHYYPLNGTPIRRLGFLFFRRLLAAVDELSSLLSSSVLVSDEDDSSSSSTGASSVSNSSESDPGLSVGTSSTTAPEPSTLSDVSLFVLSVSTFSFWS